MRIAVCIKQVPVSNDVSVDPTTNTLVRESTESMINPADLNALEEVIALKEKTDGHIVVFTMGPPSSEKGLRIALAMGCDEGCLITDKCFAGGDTIATAKVLSKAISQFGKFDLIVTGASSADGATGQVGAVIAEYLDIASISEIKEISYESNNIKVLKKFHNTTVTLQPDLPALLTVSFGCNDPRLVTLRAQRSAKDKLITTYTNKNLQMQEDKIGLLGSPTIVINSFKPEVTKKAVMLSGDLKEMAHQMMDLIKKEKGKC